MYQEPFASEREPLSYWQETAPALSLSSAMPTHTTVVVIGGGLLGSATCYWLARRGIPVVLLEQRMLAAGATGRNAGFISVGPDEAYDQAIVRLGHETASATLHITQESQALLRQILRDEAIECDYREPGHLHLALTDEQLNRFSLSLEALQRDGVAATMMTRGEMTHLIHTPLGSRIQGGLFVPHMALVHPTRLVQGLCTAASKYGAQIITATVQHLQREGETIRLFTTQGTILAQRVVVATNAWLSDLLPSLIPFITSVRGQILAYHPLPLVFPHGMTADLSGAEEYWQQTPDGMILLGGCRMMAPGHDIGIRESFPTIEVQQALEGVFPQLFPYLSGLRVVQRWAGLMAFTPDFLPIVDVAPDFPHTWFVGGFGGHGMPFGLRFGQLLAETVLNGTTPSALTPFRLSRPTLQRHKTWIE